MNGMKQKTRVLCQNDVQEFYLKTKTVVTTYWMWGTASSGGCKYPHPHQTPLNSGSVQMFNDDLFITLLLLIAPWSVYLPTPRIILARSSQKVGTISEMKNQIFIRFGGTVLRFS